MNRNKPWSIRWRKPKLHVPSPNPTDTAPLPWCSVWDSAEKNCARWMASKNLLSVSREVFIVKKWKSANDSVNIERLEPLSVQASYSLKVQSGESRMLLIFLALWLPIKIFYQDESCKFVHSERTEPLGHHDHWSRRHWLKWFIESVRKHSTSS